MGISEIEAIEHSLRTIFGQSIPDDLFREVSEEVEQGTLLGCVAQAPNLSSLATSIRHLLEDMNTRIEQESDPEQAEYLKAVREELEELDRAFLSTVEGLIAFLEERVVKVHFRLHDRFPSHRHDD